MDWTDVVAESGTTLVEDTGGGCVVAFFRTNFGMVTVNDESVAVWDEYRPDMIGDGEWVEAHWTDSAVYDGTADLSDILSRALQGAPLL